MSSKRKNRSKKRRREKKAAQAQRRHDDDDDEVEVEGGSSPAAAVDEGSPAAAAAAVPSDGGETSSGSRDGGEAGKKRRRPKKKRAAAPSSPEEEECAASSSSPSRSGPADAPSPSSPPPPPPPPPPNSFESVRPALSPGILSHVSSCGFSSMTPVQSAVIPLFLTHKDVCVRAVTGSGKTLAFLIPCVEMILRRESLLKRRQVGALVISPTRELARQTYTVAGELCSRCGLPAPLLLVGGTRPVEEDLRSFSSLGSDVVVATPGRLDDILGRYDDLDVSELEVLVLDEADVLLDMGFDVALTSILGRLPRMRRTGLFSATRPGSGVRELMRRAGMRNPVAVSVAVAREDKDGNKSSLGGGNGGDGDTDGGKGAGEERVLTSLKSATSQPTPTTLTNYVLLCPLTEKLTRLTAFLRQHRDEKVIVFFLTCACVEFYGAALRGLLRSKKGEQPDYYLETLHGRMVQKRREKAMERFRAGGTNDEGDGDEETDDSRRGASRTDEANGGAALLCTDVAARGLDVAGVDWVVQYDAPVDPSQYVHRVGRTARAGKTGKSLLFLTDKEEAYVDFLRRRNVPLERAGEIEQCAPPVTVEDDDEEGAKGEMRPKRRKEAGEDANDGNGVESGDGDGQEPVKLSKERLIWNASDELLPDALPEVREMVLRDRDILEKGTRAFTSYIRAYKEHHCAFIFRFASLDLGLLATSFCLLRLPKMPELRDKLGKLRFVPAGPEVDIHAIPFRDRVRERARQKRLAAELAAGGKNAKQIKAEQRAAERERKRKERRAEAIAKGRNPDKKRGRQARIFDEWDELAKEERLHKKLRKHKITKEEFKRLMYGDKAKEGGDGDNVLDSDVEV